MPSQTYPAQFEYLDEIREFVARAARQAGMDEKDVYNVQLATDEAASNVIEHAYEGIPDGQLTISTHIRRDALVISLRDMGQTFDPSLVADPDIAAGLDERGIGGLGLFFMRKLMDEVHYLHNHETGENTLTLLKRRAAPKKPSDTRPGWHDLFEMGERLITAPTFAAQRDLIVETSLRLVQADVTLWLDESVFRLPDWVESVFTQSPDSEAMRLAFETGKTIRVRNEDAYTRVIPLKHEETGLGALTFSRQGMPFRKREEDIMEGLARTASISLLAWHRIGVERWRIGQLNLVRTVAAQIANEPDVDELARRVTRLIQATFRYYYVAIFTTDRARTALEFRSSAGGATRRKGRPTAPSLAVDWGQGLIGQAALLGEEIIANDVRAESRFRPVDSLPETLSEAVIPLKIEDRVLGVLDIQSDHLNAFHPYDLLVLRALADSIALAIEGAGLYGDLTRRASHLKAVAEVSKQITSILHLRELMQAVADTIHQKFDYPYVHLFTVHPNRRQIHYEAGSGARSAALEGYILDLDDSEGIVSWVARNGQGVFANDVEKDPRYRVSPLPPANTLSELAVPLIFSGQVVGVLDVQSDQLNAFSDEDHLLFETLADGIAAAIRNADLYRSEQWRRQVGDSLREVAGLLSANASLEHVLDSILTELERNLPSDIAAIWLLGEEDIYLAAAHGARMEDIDRARYDWPDCAATLVMGLSARQPIIRKPTDPIGPSGIAGNFSPDYSSIAAPLRIGDQAVGVLTLSHHTPGRYGHEAHAMATTFASYAAVAIENARLYDAAQEQAYASAALLQVAQAVVSLSDLDEILGTIVRIMPILVGVERALIYTWDSLGEMFIPAQAYGLPDGAENYLWRQIRPEQFPLLAAAMTQGVAVFSSQAHLGVERWHTLQPLVADGTLLYEEDRLLMALPLVVKGETFGILLAEEAVGGRRFRNRRIEILHGIAQQIALAIQNDLFQQEMVARERLEIEVRLARQIQQTFIPDKLPSIPCWDLSARWRTARQVGGDFYDVFELPNQRIGLFIADVADKGVPAALFMALTRTLMRAAVLETDSPAQALRRVNDLLYPDCEQGMFVTGVYGVLDTHASTFTYANAGHNPPLFISAGGVERLTRTGMALGVVDGVPMDERSLHLEPGDAILFYTDGVTEAFNPEEEIYGEHRLLDVIHSRLWQSSSAILDALDESLNEFMGAAPPADDITLLSVLRTKAE